LGSKNPEKPDFVVSSIQDINKLVRSAAKLAAENPAKEVHIRLTAEAADSEASLNTLKNCLEGNFQAAASNSFRKKIPVYIHVPASASGGNMKETIIRTEGSMSDSIPASIGVLAKCAAVAEVWEN
jgi:hypothetical protein